MSYVKEISMTGVNTRTVAQFLGLSSLTVALPFFIHLQWATGPIVNALLIIVLFLIGIRSALVLCLIPSLMALASGLLPAVLAPVVPFIMIANVLYVLVIEWVYTNFKDDFKGYWLGIIAGSLVKFLFLYFSVKIISGILIKQELMVKVAQMMSWSQLITALSGGMLAWIFLKWLKRL
jgi:hypothetical protein